jgi:hypothetical protein
VTWWVVVALSYAVTVVFAAGVVWADERRAADWPVGLGDWLLWVGSYVLVAGYWPVVWLARRTSRPVPRGRS